MSEKYRTLITAHYNQRHGLTVAQNDPIAELKEHGKDPEHMAAMTARYEELLAFSSLCGDEFHRRDYVGHIELIALKRLFQMP